VLESTDTKTSWIDAVMGHESEVSEGKIYTKRVAISQLNEVVQGFVSPFDLSMLLRKI
jgi:hypothetical protein